MKLFKTLSERWRDATPRFFKRIIYVGSVVSGVALAIHVALVAGNAIEPQWWQDIYPYLIGVPAGMAAVAKLTKEGNEQK